MFEFPRMPDLKLERSSVFVVVRSSACHVGRRIRADRQVCIFGRPSCSKHSPFKFLVLFRAKLSTDAELPVAARLQRTRSTDEAGPGSKKSSARPRIYWAFPLQIALSVTICSLFTIAFDCKSAAFVVPTWLAYIAIINYETSLGVCLFRG